MRFSICLETFYPRLDIPQRLERLHAAGFAAVEFWSPYDKDLPGLAEEIRRLGMEVVCFSAHRRASPVRSDELEAFLAELERNAAAARALSCPALIVLSDALEPDGAAKPAPLSPQRKLLNLVRALERAVPLAERHGITLLLEPLNLQDHPGYFLHRTDWAVAALEAVASPRLKLLCDVYHAQCQEGHILETLSAHLEWVGHLHLADVPGRHEPGEGELNFSNILKTLQRWGYRGSVGFECFPAREEARALGAIRRLIAPFCQAQEGSP